MDFSTFTTTSWIKLGLALLFIGCLTDMPYGYFQFVRFAGMIGFAYLAYLEKDTQSRGFFYFFIVSAILINPLIKISLGRVLWNLVDIVWAGVLIWDVFKNDKK